MTKPPFQYFGAKQRIASRIVDLLPPHRHYIEPFAGSLAVLLAKPPSSHETVNDLDGDIMHFWSILRNNPVELERVCSLTPHSRQEYNQSYVRTECSDIERARRTWVCLTQGRGGQLTQTGWRHFVKPHGSTNFPKYLRGYTERIADVANRLKMVSLECQPALKIIAQYGQHPDCLLYVDPPYLGSSRCAQARYPHEMANVAQHAELASALTTCNAMVAISGYQTSLYEQLYADWSCTKIATSTEQGGYGSPRQEMVWLKS